ncbi:MAG: cell division protein FtsZ [Elusimicrobiota bacterium]
MDIKLSVEASEKRAVIKVIGVGGGGSNAVSHMVDQKIQGVEFIAANTDVQALAKSAAPTKVQLGEKISKGLGVGGNPVMGRQCTEENSRRLNHMLAGTDMVFITAGMGGGTGTGGAPVVASIAKSLGVLTIGIVTKPFIFEGKVRMQQAENGILNMKDHCDTTIVIPNEKVLSLHDKQTNAQSAFKNVDAVLCRTVRSVSEIITKHGMINRDMADLKAILQNSGEAFIGMGESFNQTTRAKDAANQAVNSPLLEEVTINGAGRVLVNIFGGMDITIGEIEEAMDIIHSRVSRDAHIYYGQVLDQALRGTFRISVVATDFTKQVKAAEIDRKKDEKGYWDEPAFKVWQSRKLT